MTSPKAAQWVKTELRIVLGPPKPPSVPLVPILPGTRYLQSRFWDDTKRSFVLQLWNQTANNSKAFVCCEIK